ncbi:MAG TPA: two-component regulator propeller domain-containing protein [Cyclobacteriaceae bacterium]|nr:two-component regulator propeller domain-containing protein [Cyclobacteriaceae bacterium]
MTRFSRILLAILFASFGIISRAQEFIPLGTWRTHIAYNRANRILIAGEKIYCIAGNGLFYFDRSDNSLGVLSRVNGLSDVVITSAAYDGNETVVFGYDNGNVDIIRGNSILNFAGLKESVFAGVINDILISGSKAYLAIANGIVVMDIEQNEIFETWTGLGNSGNPVPVNSLVIFNDTIFAGTEEGVIAGAMNPGINLADYHQWKRFREQDGLPQLPASRLALAGNGILAALDDRYLYLYPSQTWEMIKDYGTEKILTVSSSWNVTSVVTDAGIELLDINYFSTELNHPLIQQPQFGITDQEGITWIADGMNGLISGVNGDFQSMYPEGPFFSEVSSVKYINNSIVALPAGMSGSGLPLRNDMGFSVFRQGKWKNYNNSPATNQLPGPPVLDLVDVDYNNKSGITVFASYGYGLVTWDGQDVFTVIDENSPGSLMFNSNPPERNTLISSVYIGQDGKTYMANHNAPEPLITLSSSGGWNSIALPLSGIFPFVQLLKPGMDKIWMRTGIGQGGGIVILNEITGESGKITTTKNEGGLPGSQVNDLALDRDGMMWVATDKGVAYFPYPADALDDPELNAVTPVFDNRFLLRGEYITCLAVDGANNKWIGTRKGAWLFNEDGSRLIHDFTAGNSPMLSDEILDIGIHEETGEVFFCTAKGLISYRGTATTAAEETGDVRIFPNPVPPGFTGMIGIEGLAFGSILKITDVNGNLVFETQSMGGTASWNTLGLSGSKVSTGVYIVFSATPDGENHFVGKLAIIR